MGLFGKYQCQTAIAQKVIKKGLMKRLRNCLEEVPHEKKINCLKASIPKKKRIHGGDESRCSRVLYLEEEVEFFPKKWSEAHALIRWEFRCDDEGGWRHGLKNRPKTFLFPGKWLSWILAT